VSKATVTRLFVGAFVAVVAGALVGLAAVLTAIGGGVVTIGGPEIVTVNGAAFAGTLVWLVMAKLLIAGGALAALASWIGALLNTAQLEDKTWFIALLVLGLFSFGWIAMIAFVLAGPDSTRQGETAPAIAAARTI
jgi:hypothetical protein